MNTKKKTKKQTKKHGVRVYKVKCPMVFHTMVNVTCLQLRCYFNIQPSMSFIFEQFY